MWQVPKREVRQDRMMASLIFRPENRFLFKPLMRPAFPRWAQCKTREFNLRIGIFLVRVRRPLVWWIEIRAPASCVEGFFFIILVFHATSERRRMLFLFVVWPSHLGTITLQCPDEKRYQLEMFFISCDLSLEEGVQSLQFGTDVTQFYGCIPLIG